ncbi:hypothetical protein GCM10022244_22390 [Streptomyces gulbargensis]|uniref:Uncharacterized protein n=1 Tax=Streptomyces gulbargensis TaxID=364901 RepID=A0ABP7M159_9ACTN
MGEFGPDGGAAGARRVHAGDPVAQGAERDLGEAAEGGAGVRRAGRVERAAVGGLVAVEQGPRVPVEQALYLRPRRGAGGGLRAAGEGEQQGRQAGRGRPPHRTAVLDRHGPIVRVGRRASGARAGQTRVTVTCDIMFTGS